MQDDSEKLEWLIVDINVGHFLVDALNLLEANCADHVTCVIFLQLILSLAVSCYKLLNDLTILDLSSIGEANELLERVIKPESLEEMVEEESIRYFRLFSEFTSLIVIIFRQYFAIHTFMYVILRIYLITQAKQPLNSTENVDSNAIRIYILIEWIHKVNDIIRVNLARLEEHLEPFSEKVGLDILVDHLDIC